MTTSCIARWNAQLRTPSRKSCVSSIGATNIKSGSIAAMGAVHVNKGRFKMEVGCYTMDLYCDCDVKHEYRAFPHQFFGSTRAQCAREAKKSGWKWTNKSLSCPSCTKAKIKPAIVSLLAFLLISTASFGAEIRGLVIGVHDGDTITIRSNDKIHRIRLFGIDSPELKQRFGKECQCHCATMILGKEVVIEKRHRSYRRIVGRVFCDGEDIGRRMLQDGFAWHSTKYSNDMKYAASSLDAFESKRGIWIDGRPTPPWEWRLLSPSNR